MRLTIYPALNKVIHLLRTTIQKVTRLTKLQLNFLMWQLKRRWMLPVRSPMLTQVQILRILRKNYLTHGDTWRSNQKSN